MLSPYLAAFNTVLRKTPLFTHPESIQKRLFLPSPQFVLGEGPKGKVQTLLNQPVAGEQLLYLLNIHGVILYKGIREKNLIKYIKF